MIDAFDPVRADLSGMDGSLDLYVDNVYHKAFISVDEKGTEASAHGGRHQLEIDPTVSK